MITTAHAHKSGVIFHIFQELSNKKLKALRPKMTKIALRGSCLKLVSDMPASNGREPQASFEVLAQARNELHLGIMEADFITVMKPKLCCLKEIARFLALLRL